MARTKHKRDQMSALSDELRSFILNSEMSRYAIAKASGVDQSQLHRFVHGTGRVTSDCIDAVAPVLRLRLVKAE